MNPIDQRFETEIEWLTEGRNLKYEGVVFSIQNKILSVSSYSSYINLENITEKKEEKK